MPFFILAGAGILSSVIGAGAASSAANTQAQAAEQAAQIQQQEFQQTQANEAPYMAAGGNALTQLQKGLGLGPGGTGQGPLNTPFNPADLSQTPGYKFALGQGEQAITDTATATGGVGGGNTLKELTQYGQGLASTTYQQQLADYMAQQNQAFGQLDTLAGSGQNAAANLGALGNQAAATSGQDLIGAANATSAGQIGVANALSGGISSLSSNYLLMNLIGGGGFGGSFGGGAAAGGGYDAFAPGG